MAVAAIVMLRLAIGFHFYYEGVAKLKDPKPFSSMFLGAAKGPLAGFYRGMVYDADGEARLNQDTTKKVWEQFVAQAKRHYGFDEKQAEEADRVLGNREAHLKGYFDSIASELDEYNKGLNYVRNGDRQDRTDDMRVRVGVASLKGQWDKTESELKSKRGPWLANLDKINKGLESGINDLATSEQSRRGALKISKPGRRMLDSDGVDSIIPYFDLIVGGLLVVGLFTRTASIAGALFLASVVASQWPGTPGAASTAYQAIEMISLLVLAAMGAGQLAGLDFFVANFFGKRGKGVGA